MKITIFKYLKPTAVNGNDNYFFNTSNPAWKLSYYDKISFVRQPLDSFPIFREEWQAEEDVDILKTGYFDVKLALTMTELSATRNVSVYRFFENMQAAIYDYRFLVICETDHYQRNYSGFIDNNTINTDETINDRQYYLYFSVTGIEKEVVQCMKQNKIARLLADKDFENVYLPYLLQQMLGTKLELNSQLNINSKIGYTLKIDKTIYNKLFDANFNTTLETVNISVWDAFKSFLIGYQFRFNVKYTMFSSISEGPYPKFIMTLFFRSEAYNTVSISKLLTNKKSFISFGKKCVAILYTKLPSVTDTEITLYTGVVISREMTYITTNSTRIRYNSDAKVYYLDNNFTVKEEEITIINLPLYNGNLSAGDIAICKSVSGQDINSLLEYIAATQLPYLLEAEKMKKTATVKVPNNSSMILGSKAEFDGNNFTLERINSYDNFNNTMETEWIQE